MDKILIIFNLRIDQILSIIDGSNKYFELIKDTVISSDPIQAQKFSEHVSKVKSIVDVIKSANLSSENTSEKVIKEFSDIYDKFESIYISIDFMINVIENPTHTKNILINMSQTYATNLQQQKNKILGEAEELFESVIENDTNIFNLIMNGIEIRDVIEIVISMAIVHVNKFIIYVIDRIILFIENNKDLKSRYSKIYEIVEGLKDKTLNASRIDLNIKYHPLMSILPRYNLVAMGKSQLIEDLFNHLNIKYPKLLTPTDNLKSIAELNDYKIGVVIIYNITNSPIEFNLLPLVSIDYVTKNDLMTTPGSGINKKSLERLRTVKVLNTPSAEVPRVEKFIKEKTEYVYIFETLNGSEFRILSNNLENTNKYVSVNEVRGIIEGLNLRADAYNDIINTEIIAKCFDSKSDLVIKDYEREKKSLPSSSVIKSSILSDLVEEFRKILKESVPTSETQFKNLAIAKNSDDSYISKVISDKLTHNYGIIGKGSVEYTLTYITKLDQIIRVFNRELGKNISMIKLTPLTFKERNGNNLIEYILDSYLSAAKNAIETLDRPPSIWVEYDFSLKEFYLTSKYLVI